MRITTLNVNGIRSAAAKGFFGWMRRHNPDVLRSEAKMTRVEIGHIVARTRLFGWSNRWLSGYYRQLAVAPPGTSRTNEMEAQP